MKKFHKIIVLLVLFLLVQNIVIKAQNQPFLKFMDDAWVNEQLESLTMEEKIAQLLMVPVYPKLDEERKAKALEAVAKWKIGGILVMQGTPTKTVKWINEFQNKSELPLLVAIDGEWGAAMRIDSVLKFPYAQAIGAVSDSTFIYEMGRDMGQQLKEMGIQMNFAPVADVNTNPANPVINFRSFGEDKKNVANRAWWVAKGMQDEGIIAVAKHFPGHGDTDTDSHKTLPYLKHSKKRMDEIETYPFRYMSAKGISGIMSAHLNVPSLDETETPSSLSSKIIIDYLKGEIGFKGFVVTDALNMNGVSKSGNVTLEAITAGNDLAEFVPDVEKAVTTIKAAIEKGEIDSTLIIEKCRRILALKRWTNLNEYKAANTKNLHARLNSLYHEITIRKLIKNSLTVLTNNEILPVQNLENLKIASVNIGGNKVSAFQKMLGKYTSIDHFYIPKSCTEQEWVKLRQKLENYKLIIGDIEGINIYPGKQYGTSEIQQRIVDEIIQNQKSIFVFFGNAYAIKHFGNIHHSKGLIVAYQNNLLTQQLAAQAIFGAFDLTGKLPVTIDQRFKLNDGIQVKKNDTFSYTIPEEVNIDSKQLHHLIDSIALLGIAEKAYPGCQVLVAKNGKVIFHECYGFHTYQNVEPVVENSVYDWASITKVTGPLPAIMKMVDEKKMNLDAPFSTYWPDFKNSNKQKIKLREVLAHQAQLQSWIAFWQMTVNEKGTLDKKVFKSHPSKKFSVRVSENMYMNSAFRKTMFDTIRNSELLPRKKYLYSGLSFYLYPEIISNFTGQPFEDYLKNTFYKPLGANTITYNAYQHFPLKQIVPTEYDDFFRKENLHGFVHDEGASMMGGISGNAGLFGSTIDLAKIFQMYLQKGYFGGRRYISEKTINEFIRIQYPENENRRGLGFDKPLIDNNENKLEDAYPAVSTSKNSFGHSGYTGTFAWADPDIGLLFIFMSNRVLPTRENQKLYNFNIRTAMHQAIYDCFDTAN